MSARDDAMRRHPSYAPKLPVFAGADQRYGPTFSLYGAQFSNWQARHAQDGFVFTEHLGTEHVQQTVRQRTAHLILPPPPMPAGWDDWAALHAMLEDGAL